MNSAGRLPPGVPSRTLAYRLDVRTVNELNGAHNHWSTVSRRRRSFRQLAMYSTMARVRNVRFPILVTITRVAPRKFDPTDGGLQSALKSIRDGIADGLYLRNDEDERVQWKYEQRSAGKGKYAVDIKVEEFG